MHGLLMKTEIVSYHAGRTPLRHPRFPQLIGCRLRILRRPFALLFILAQVYDGNVGFVSREDGKNGTGDGQDG